ncbi:UNVERIFIED_ORG: hypothetical protein M2438_005318 [Methylobacterium sp. SuP10 SLI 274]|uniref:hypothetical protein n=1 Tax=Methylorubrum extorquens TaxID=408 RepID=UPI00209F4D25|nr:hypothetical protein [Methylorubrum extorquens]MDF9861096.1 hypothetical protein [Methylorubrum pseudosasae]MDH6640072.1 hypothetical protein [Methylobacterium sp. SuP10 SLI 274]MDH6669170.1 hypothetical protein [Methylorubrum zatmanii]MCP1556816.1 hypothetical protein [Methylorubrum extorquens]MDF9789407.1 hypothetical protein [Methylorubrum extorquens]
MPRWPADQLLRHGPELPLAEQVRRYQHNIRTIREAGCVVPRSAYVDTLDPVEIEMWFVDSAERKHRLKAAIQGLAALPPEPEPE